MNELTMELELEKQEADTPTAVERTRPRRTYAPRVDIYETDDQVVLLADMPGLDETSVDITLEKNILIVRGQVEVALPEDYELARAEYHISDYERTFSLSDEVDRTKIDATVKNGVLRLVLPKNDSVKARKIAVRSEA